MMPGFHELIILVVVLGGALGLPAVLLILLLQKRSENRRLREKLRDLEE